MVGGRASCQGVWKTPIEGKNKPTGAFSFSKRQIAQLEAENPFIWNYSK